MNAIEVVDMPKVKQVEIFRAHKKKEQEDFENLTSYETESIKSEHEYCFKLCRVTFKKDVIG